MLIALSSSPHLSLEAEGEADFIYQVISIHNRIRSDSAEYVVLEVGECAPTDSSADPLVIKLGKDDAIQVLWHQRSWRLVDGSAMAILSILAGAGTIKEDKIDDSIERLRKLLRQKDGQKNSAKGHSTTGS